MKETWREESPSTRDDSSEKLSRVEHRTRLWAALINSLFIGVLIWLMNATSDGLEFAICLSS